MIRKGDCESKEAGGKGVNGDGQWMHSGEKKTGVDTVEEDIGNRCRHADEYFDGLELFKLGNWYAFDRL